MKLAVLLFGISKQESLSHWSENKYVIDYKHSCENYKKFIFDFFIGMGYDIDVYFTTNRLNDRDKEELCRSYKPVKYNFTKNYKSNTTSRNTKLDNVIDLCLNSGVTYDLILITRFDLLFQKEFNKSNVNFDKFNLVSMLEQPNLICDNFYLFPYKYLKIFSGIVKRNLRRPHHRIQQELYDKVGANSVNYILNEGCLVADLSFYKIVRNS